MKLSPLAAPVLLVLGASAARADEPTVGPRYAGSEISVKHSFSIASLMPGFEPDYNPVLVQSISIDPVWRLNDRLRLTGHLGVETELTDSDVSSYERQPLVEDTTVTATYRLPELPADLQASASFRLTLPTSKEAIARERIAGFAPAASVKRAFHPREDVTLAPFVTVRASYNWQLTTSLVYDGPTISACSAERGDACEEFDHSGQRSAVAGFVEVLGVSAELPHDVALTAQAWWVQSWLYDLTPAFAPDGQPIATRDGSTDWRFANVYLLAADWQITPRWKASGGFQTENPQQRPDGSYYAPFFNRYTQFFVTAAAVF
jgi:hypothetical protein